MTSVHHDAPDPPRIAFAIGRSVGSAVERNRLRRRLRAAVSAHTDTLRPGSAYLVTAHGSTTDASYADLARDLGELLESPEPPRGSP